MVAIRKCWKKDRRIHLHFDPKRPLPIDWTEVWFEDNCGKSFYICQIDDDDTLFREVSNELKENDYAKVRVNRFLVCFVKSIRFKKTTYYWWKFYCDVAQNFVLSMFAIVVFVAMCIYLNKLEISMPLLTHVLH